MSNVAHLPCPFVSCGSSDAFSYNTEGFGKCHSCNRSYPHKDEVYDWAKEEYPTDIDKPLAKKKQDHMSYQFEEISHSPVVGGSHIPMRGITQKTMEFYNVLTHGDHQEYIYPSGGIKVRRLSEKAFYAKKGFKGDELFGMSLFPSGSSKIVTVTEGEVDALSAYQMLSGNGFTSPVVSLPSATPSGKLWDKCRAWLDSFDKIVLSTDNDEAGRKVAEVMFDLFPTKVFVMDHGIYKDANDFLQAGKQREYKASWWAAKRYSPAGFTASVDDWLKAIDGEDPYEYTPTPIEEFNKVARGLVKGGITVIKAPPGTGKSSYLRMLMHDLIMTHKKTIACLMMEEMKSITGRAMATYELGINVKTKEDAENNGVSEGEVKEALVKVIGQEKFISFDINPQDPVEDTLSQCKHAITVYGAEYIFIDHLQRLAYLTGTEGATAALTELGVKLTELAKRRNVGIICISHVNSEGKTKYASSIEEEAIVLIEMSRDKKSEDVEERNTTCLEVSKNRPYAITGPAGMLAYDITTDTVAERKGPPEPVTNRSKDDGIPF